MTGTKKTATNRVLPVFIFTCLELLIFASEAQATRFWTNQDYLRFQKSHLIETYSSLEPGLLQPAEQYVLLYEYIQICDFLTVMQELDPGSPDFGGMHEGETPDLWAIVETDNTQEAIRVWSTYAELSGDLETYRDNVEAAWVYTMNYPAYDEEGSDSDYYRVHNCGWALVAESKYRQVYGDDTYLWYADSCASYIEGHRLPYTGVSEFYIRLHPLVEGWAAGTLYDYGIEQGNPAAEVHALDVGSDVQVWIAEDPTRLSINEVWAMSGGTAMWGVCRSVFTDDPLAGQTWLPDYLPYMDTYAGPGQWNNSWNVWYAHAYHASAAVLQNSLYTGYAFSLVDTLLDADTDDDGGIMATSTDPPTMDQSWVSCYLDYMGLEIFINGLPNLDATALGFLLPDSSLPVALGEPQEVTVMVANSGLTAFGSANVNVSGAYSATNSTFFEFADVDTLDMGTWIPQNTGYMQLLMTLSPGGEIVENDSASIWVQVLGWGDIQGTVTDLSSGQPLAADLSFYRDGFPPDQPLYTTSTDSLTGLYQISAMDGVYRVVVDPQIPYTDREATGLQVLMGETAQLDFELTPAPVLLVDDDGGSLYEVYFTVPLVNAGYDTYVWNVQENGEAQDELQLFQAVIWFTGNETENTLTAGDESALIGFLDLGGNLLLTGQNIAEDIASEPFLADYLGVSFESANSGQYQVYGTPEDPVTSGMNLLLVGAGGAQNQTSTDVIGSVYPGIEAMNYAGGAQPGAAVRVESDYKSIFVGFGLEGVSGLAGSTSRQEFLDVVLQWFEVPSGVPFSPETTLPQDFELLSLSPNPFNSNVSIDFFLPVAEFVDLNVFNVSGQSVAKKVLGFMQAGEHRIGYQFEAGLGSGVYIFVMKSQNELHVARGVLMK